MLIQARSGCQGTRGETGTAAFEYEKDGRDPLPGLAESVGYVRGILAASGEGEDPPEPPSNPK